MKIIHLIIFLFSSLIFFGQSKYNDDKISNSTKEIVQKIEDINELMSSAVYESGRGPKQWDNFEILKKTAGIAELIKLTDHPNGVIRCYAFWALSLKKEVDLFSIAKSHLQDDELIKTQFGCIFGEEMVGDFFINVITPNYIDLDSRKMNPKELAELDSLLIYQTNKLSSRLSAIKRAKTTEKIYPKIRELVVEQNIQSALVTLAKYQKKEDIEIIVNNRQQDEDSESGYYYTYAAISQFSNDSFIPLLESNLKKSLDNTHWSTEWRELYKAIASYKNQKAVELLKIPFTDVEHQNIREYHIDFIYKAIQQFQNPIYNELYWQIWEEENKVSIKTYKYLLSLNASRAFELTKKKMFHSYNLKETKFIPEIKNVEFIDNIYESMLNVLMQNDKEFATSVIIEQIHNANVHDFPIYSAKTNNGQEFIDPLFNRLKTESNPHTYLNIVKTLIAYNNENVNNRILKTRKKNKKLRKNWGGKALDRLLAENNIK